jgi:hypothetical protein
MRKPPTLREFSTRFIEWVKTIQRLKPSGKKYYVYGWRRSRLYGLGTFLGTLTKPH